MSIQVPNVYSERRDTEDEISNLKARLSAAELKLEDINKQIAEQTPTKADKLAEEIAQEIADEKEELGILRKQVDNKVAYIYKLMQEAVANKPRGGKSVVCYHIAVDGEHYRYNLRGDMFSMYSDEFLGHWDGTKLDRSAKPPENRAVFPSFYPTKEFKMTV